MTCIDELKKKLSQKIRVDAEKQILESYQGLVNSVAIARCSDKGYMNCGKCEFRWDGVCAVHVLIKCMEHEKQRRKYEELVEVV